MTKRRNPLSEQETVDFEKYLVEKWRETYNKAIKCGAFSDEFFEFGDHTIAKFAVVVMGDDFLPLDKNDKKVLDNFRKF